MLTSQHLHPSRTSFTIKASDIHAKILISKSFSMNITADTEDLPGTNELKDCISCRENQQLFRLHDTAQFKECCCCQAWCDQHYPVDKLPLKSDPSCRFKPGKPHQLLWGELDWSHHHRQLTCMAPVNARRSWMNILLSLRSSVDFEKSSYFIIAFFQLFIPGTYHVTLFLFPG